MILPSSITIELEELAQRIARIRAVGRNGDLEGFYEDRSQCARDLLDLIDWIRTGQKPAEYMPIAERIRDARRVSYAR